MKGVKDGLVFTKSDILLINLNLSYILNNIFFFLLVRYIEQVNIETEFKFQLNTKIRRMIFSSYICVIEKLRSKIKLTI